MHPRALPTSSVVLLDDVGFGATSTFGGPVATPTLDRLAQDGLRYNQFHTTALCSPTRAALLTGRNHHSAHTGVVMEVGTGYPGYDTVMQQDTATVAEVLQQNGWSTAWFGKNHNVPDWQSSQAGPFDLWPSRAGLRPLLRVHRRRHEPVAPRRSRRARSPSSRTSGKPDYNLDYDHRRQGHRLDPHAEGRAPDQPFFVYYAPGATHAPHHPRKEWIEKYKGKFDQGWDRVREETLAAPEEAGRRPRRHAS